MISNHFFDSLLNRFFSPIKDLSKTEVMAAEMYLIKQSNAGCEIRCHRNAKRKNTYVCVFKREKVRGREGERERREREERERGKRGERERERLSELN